MKRFLLNKYEILKNSVSVFFINKFNTLKNTIIGTYLAFKQKGQNLKNHVLNSVHSKYVTFMDLRLIKITKKVFKFTFGMLKKTIKGLKVGSGFILKIGKFTLKFVYNHPIAFALTVSTTAIATYFKTPFYMTAYHRMNNPVLAVLFMGSQVLIPAVFVSKVFEAVSFLRQAYLDRKKAVPIERIIPSNDSPESPAPESPAPESPAPELPAPAPNTATTTAAFSLASPALIAAPLSPYNPAYLEAVANNPEHFEVLPATLQRTLPLGLISPELVIPVAFSPASNMTPAKKEEGSSNKRSRPEEDLSTENQNLQPKTPMFKSDRDEAAEVSPNKRSKI